MRKTILSITSIFLIVIISGCQVENELDKPNLVVIIPDIKIDANSKLITRKRGVLYYDGLPFSGKIVSWYNEGQLATKTPYFEGKEHGLSEGWHQNGTKQFERIYDYGVKSGIHKGWWKNGQPKYIRHLAKDVFEGNVKEWYNDGQPYMDFNYVNGQEAGSQKAWKSDGRVKVNYVVKNGRKYGLTGVKNCISLVD